MNAIPDETIRSEVYFCLFKFLGKKKRVVT